MKRLLAALLLLASQATAGSLTTVGAVIGSQTELVDTYFIYPDQQMLTALETTSLGVPSPYGQLGADADILTIATWICDNRDDYNIKAVLGMGDIVRRTSTDDYAPVALFRDILDGCQLPWLLAYGNHEGDGGNNPQNPDDPNNATNYHETIGQSVMDTRGWFAGSRAERPDWVEFADALEYFSTYAENTTTYKSRTFWVPVPPLNIAVPEWDYGIRISKSGPDSFASGWDGRESFARPWLREIRDRYPHDYWVNITHAGPCEPQNCDLTPRSLGNLFGPMGGDWSAEFESLGPNYVAFLNGHWGAGASLGCWGGAGAYASAVRDDGSAWIAGVFDFNCGTRLDPSVAGNTCPANGQGIPSGACPGADCLACVNNGYTWQGWMQIKRTTRQLCLDTVRTIDVDSDDDGDPDRIPALAVDPPELDRGATYGDPDGVEEGSTGNVCDDFDSGPGVGEVGSGCPNMPATCITIRDLP